MPSSVTVKGPTENMELSEATWRKSTRSAQNGECVEVALTLPTTRVRDSKAPHGAVLQFATPAWRTFLADVKRGAFDR